MGKLCRIIDFVHVYHPHQSTSECDGVPYTEQKNMASVKTVRLEWCYCGNFHVNSNFPSPYDEGYRYNKFGDYGDSGYFKCSWVIAVSLFTIHCDCVEYLHGCMVTE